MTYLHSLRENNGIHSIIFETDDSGEAMSVIRERKSVDVWSLLMIPVKGSQEVSKVNWRPREKQMQKL